MSVVRLGTRGSLLALAQTEWVAARLVAMAPGLEVEVEKIRTSGDRFADRPLWEIGGKGLFTKEIEEALLAGRVDCGVHSMKDLPAVLPRGLEVVAVPEREDPADVLVSSPPGGLADLPRGARVGTSSLRRAALLRSARPDLQVVPLRGNVETRIRKWRAGEIDALVLARAGLSRLGLDVAEARPLSADEVLPAIGQGALALEASPENAWSGLFRRLDDPSSSAAVGAERAFLVAVGGDCKTPVAAHAVVKGGSVWVRAMIADPEGTRVVRGEIRGPAAETARLGAELGGELLGRGGREILEALGA